MTSKLSSKTRKISKSDAMRVFVASSSEQVAVARRVATALRAPQLEPNVWDKKTFNFSESYIESLEVELDKADFAVVILTADDSANVRSKKVNLPRDNIIFELGLFIGRLGRERCFFLIDSESHTKVASDLSGVNPVTFSLKGAARDPGHRPFASQMARLRTQMLESRPRYKPSKGTRNEQDDRWWFSRRISGHWWERMRAGEDDNSALSYLKITVDEVTNSPQLHGWVYGLDGKPMADWKSVLAGVILGEEPKILYRWAGEHDAQKGQTFGGIGEIIFDDEALHSASSYYYDTNLASLPKGGHTFVKHCALFRCNSSDEKTMSERRSDAARKLVRARLASLGKLVRA
jgi:predicted nucleotide-binding protein